MKTLTTLLLTLLVLGGCSQEPKYGGLWLIDREQTKANCEAIFQETNNANEEFSNSNEEDSSDFDWAEAFGKALESLLCSGAEVIFPVLDIKENSFSLSVFGAELLCKIDENANNVDCTNQTKITDVAPSEDFLNASDFKPIGDLILSEDTLTWKMRDISQTTTIDLIYTRR